MISFTQDENRLANSFAQRIIVESNKRVFDVDTIIEDCETNARNKMFSEPFRECMAHAAQFLKLAIKYDDKIVLELAELAVMGTMYCNLYE